MSEGDLLPTFFDHGDGELIPMEFTNSLFEHTTTSDVYDDIHSELEEKRQEHKKLMSIRTTARKKIHAYEMSLAELRQFLVECHREPSMKDLVPDILDVLSTIPTDIDSTIVGQFRTTLHGMVLKYTRDLRQRIHMLQDVLHDMRHQIGSDDMPVGTCPICYDAAVSHCLTPCGHCLCDACLERDTARERCFMCRTPVSQIIKLYL